MIRPLIESIYDYHMIYAPEATISARNSYKTQFHQACYLIATDHVLSSAGQPGASIESAIGDWNNKNSEINRDRRQSKLDFKTRLDELFKSSGKNYYRREYQRPISRQKSAQYKQSRYSNDHHYSRSRDHNYSHHQSRYDQHHKNDSHGKHRGDRY